MFPENNERADRQKAQRHPGHLGNPPYSASGSRARTTPTRTSSTRPSTAHRRDLRRALDRHAEAQPLRLLHPRDPLGHRPHRRRRASSRSSPTATSSTATARTACARAWSTSSATSTASTCAATSAACKARSSRREGGKIFGGGSRAPVAITLLVRDGETTGPASCATTTSATTCPARTSCGALVEFRDIGAVSLAADRAQRAGRLDQPARRGLRRTAGARQQGQAARAERSSSATPTASRPTATPGSTTSAETQLLKQRRRPRPTSTTRRRSPSPSTPSGTRRESPRISSTTSSTPTPARSAGRAASSSASRAGPSRSWSTRPRRDRRVPALLQAVGLHGRRPQRGHVAAARRSSRRAGRQPRDRHHRAQARGATSPR